MILKWIFAQIFAFQWTKVKRCFGGVFYHFTIFWVQKRKKNQLFEEIKRFESSFYWIDVQMITNGQADFKNTKHLIFHLWTIFYDFFKKHLNFCIFWYFRKSSAAHTKIVACVLFNVTMLDQTQYSLFNPFSNDIFSRLESTSDFNLKL